MSYQMAPTATPGASSSRTGSSSVMERRPSGTSTQVSTWHLPGRTHADVLLQHNNFKIGNLIFKGTLVERTSSAKGPGSAIPVYVFLHENALVLSKQSGSQIDVSRLAPFSKSLCDTFAYRSFFTE